MPTPAGRHAWRRRLTPALPMLLVLLVLLALRINLWVAWQIAGVLRRPAEFWWLLEGPGGGLVALWPAAAIIVAAGALHGWPLPRQLGRLRPRRADLAIGMAAGAGVGGLFVLLAVQVGGARLGWHFDPLGLLVLQPPSNLSEDLICRGLVLQAALRACGLWPALLLSSALFGLMHGPNGLGLFLALTSIAWGFAVWRTGSLWSGWIAHQTSDLLTGSLLIG